MHLRTNSLVEELQRVAPEFRVAGGSFAHWLPHHPREVPVTERKTIRMATQREATGKCLTDLVASVGLRPVEPPRLPSGARNWPQGYTGSVSHQSTKVVAAIAPTDQTTSIGIDVERLDKKGFSMINGLDAVEQPFAVSESEGQVIVFSVKEAVYKALNPILGLPLDFTDVAVSWLPTGPARSCGVARAGGVMPDVRRSIAIPSWVAAIALWPVTVTRGLESATVV